MLKNTGLSLLCLAASLSASFWIATRAGANAHEAPPQKSAAVVEAAAPGQPVVERIVIKEVVVAAVPDPDLFAPDSDLIKTIPPPDRSPSAPVCVKYVSKPITAK